MGLPHIKDLGADEGTGFVVMYPVSLFAFGFVYMFVILLFCAYDMFTQ